MQICSAIRPAIGPAITSALLPALCGWKRVRPFADTVASWFDTGAPGRFVPTYRDWQTSGALFQDAAGTTPVTALEQLVGLSLDRSRGLRRIDVTTLTNWQGPAIGGPAFSQQPVGPVAMIGRTYELRAEVTGYVGSSTVGFVGTPFSSSGAASRSSNGPIFAILTAAGANAINLFTRDVNTATFSNVSVREIPGAHRVQTTTTNRVILTARKNLLTETECRNGVTDIPTRVGIVAASGLSWPNGITTGIEFTVPQVGTTYAYKSFTPLASTQYAVAGFIRMSDGLPPLFPQPGSPQSSANDFAIVVGGSAYVPQILADLGGGVFMVAGIGLTPGAPTSGDGFVRYGTTQTRSMIVSGFQMVPGSTVGRYQRVNTATDYDAVGFPVGLRYDGIDDGLPTAGTIDLSGSPYLSLAGAWRLEGGTGQQMLIEASNAYSANEGSFELSLNELTAGALIFARRVGAGNQYRAQQAGNPIPRGVSLGARTDATIGPQTSIDFKVNGIPAPTGGGSPGTGAALGNYVWNYGRRAGGAFYFSGVEYGDFGIGQYRSDNDMAYLDAQFAANLSEALP